MPVAKLLPPNCSSVDSLHGILFSSLTLTSPSDRGYSEDYGAYKTLLQKRYNWLNACWMPKAQSQKLGSPRSHVTSSDAKMAMDSVVKPLNPHSSGSKGEPIFSAPWMPPTAEMGIRHISHWANPDAVTRRRLRDIDCSTPIVCGR